MNERYLENWSLQAENLIKLTEILKPTATHNLKDSQPIYTCFNRNIATPDESQTHTFEWAPVYVGQIDQTNTSVSYTEGVCFKKMTFDFVKTSETTFTVNATFAEPVSEGCTEFIWFANTETHHKLKVAPGTETASLDFTIPESSSAEVDFGGIKVFLFCNDMKTEIESLLDTIFMYLDIFKSVRPLKVPDYMIQLNLTFLNETMGYNMEPRPIDFVDIDESLVKSGDFFGNVRLDGLSPMIMYGTGSHLSHCLMSLWFEDGLYIVESQGADYWPVQGIQRTKFSEWIATARKRDYNTVWLPLKQEVADKFDEQAARDWFFQTEGLPYGFHNFISGWIDTARDNIPPLLPNEFVPIGLTFYEKIDPDMSYIMFTEGMNIRLGTEGLDIEGIANAAAKVGMDVQDVMAMVEVDGWEYTGLEPRDGLSYVCSAYVASMYKAAGLFDDLDINATEFHPRDVYGLDFFDTEFVRPQACVDADPELPYCQIIGEHRVTLPKDQYSVVSVYEHMNERCGLINPLYVRPEGC